MLRIAVLSSICLLATGCVPPDCDRPDHGTCVNACCKLEFIFDAKLVAPQALIKKIATVVGNGGPDSRYFAVEANTVQPWASDASFVVQAIHETEKHIYNDTLHFASYTSTSPPTLGDTVLLAFSHSQDFIKGNFAYGDHGQNYKNLAALVKALEIPYQESALLGCPKTNSTLQPVPSLPKLNTITSRKIGTPYGCQGASMASACLSFQTDTPSADNCDVLLNGGCNTGALYWQVNNAGSALGMISDLGEVPLENLTSSAALNYHNIAGDGNKFQATQPVEVGHTYAFILARQAQRALFALKVNSADQHGAEVEAAVRMYEVHAIQSQSPGFSWDKNNTPEEALE